MGTVDTAGTVGAVGTASTCRHGKHPRVNLETANLAPLKRHTLEFYEMAVGTVGTAALKAPAEDARQP